MVMPQGFAHGVTVFFFFGLPRFLLNGVKLQGRAISSFIAQSDESHGTIRKKSPTKTNPRYPLVN